LRRPSLRSQFNQIRLWVRQGRTDAWIAHKLDISVEQLEQFKRDQRLNGEDPPPGPAPLLPDHRPLEEEEEEQPRELDRARTGDDEEVDREEEDGYEEDGEEENGDEENGDEEDRDEEVSGPLRSRRRGRRGGRRRRRRAPSSYEATFEQGDEGYGLWLDPAVADSEVYAEHWAGHREVTVIIEPDAITIRRAADRDD
jgi:hypothetical protein